MDKKNGMDDFKKQLAENLSKQKFLAENSNDSVERKIAQDVYAILSGQETADSLRDKEKKNELDRWREYVLKERITKDSPVVCKGCGYKRYSYKEYGNEDHKCPGCKREYALAGGDCLGRPTTRGKRSLLFRSNASRNEKIYFIFSYLCVIASVYGMFTNVSPSKFVQEYWLVTTLTGTSIFFLPILKDRHPENKLLGFSLRKRIALYCFTYAMIFGFTSVIFLYTVPGIFTSLTGTEYEFDSTIVAKLDRRKRCSRPVQVKFYGYGIHSYICVNDEFWLQAHQGDTVHVRSLKSALGIKITGISLKPEHDAQAVRVMTP